MKTGSMAFLPSRPYVEKSVSSIKNQLDTFHIYQGDNALGDINKFRGVENLKGYLFTLDDDILYPENYVLFMVNKIEQYSRKAVISLHGKRIKRQPIKSFYGTDFEKYRCMDRVTQDIPIHIPGTGVMAWHSSTIQFPIKDFQYKNMADIWAGIICERKKVPRICVAHKSTFLQNLYQKETPAGYSCYQSNRKRDKLITQTINSIQWNKL